VNQLTELSALNNSYFGVRHGQSLANCQSLIVSKPENGISAYGLSDEGKDQVRKSINRAKADRRLDGKIRIISSDFKRARETAEIAQAMLGAQKEIQLDSRLRERDFGDFELQSNHLYERAWQEDARDPSHTLNNVESADSVMERTSSLIMSLEKAYQGERFLLVAHGDTLQILQTAFLKISASKQREMKHLETAEICELRLST